MVIMNIYHILFLKIYAISFTSRKFGYKEQVTRGHNIVADGWAGASNPHPTQLPPQHSTKYSIQNAHFPTFRLVVTDGRTDGPTDGQSLL